MHTLMPMILLIVKIFAFLAQVTPMEEASDAHLGFASRLTFPAVLASFCFPCTAWGYCCFANSIYLRIAPLDLEKGPQFWAVCSFASEGSSSKIFDAGYLNTGIGLRSRAITPTACSFCCAPLRAYRNFWCFTLKFLRPHFSRSLTLFLSRTGAVTSFVEWAIKK